MIINRKPAGLILSAGFSSRMKEFKPLMKIGDKNSLEILIDNLRTAGVEDIFVVVGYNKDIISGFLADKGVTVVYNESFAEGMFTSIQKGVEAAADNGNDCFLMTPVDIPLIPPYIMKAVLNRYYDNPDCFTVPCFEGRKGHPLCIPAAFTEEILSSGGKTGMKSVVSKHEDELIRIDTHCEGIVLDMDTQEAYKRLVEFYNNNRYPDEEQCALILRRMETPAHVVKHCQAVTRTAVAITEELNLHGSSLSVPLVRAAGLLHDVLRTRKKHWEEGAKAALDYGYPEVADIIMDHMNYIPATPVFEVTEKDIVCLADKLRQEEKLVTLEERLEPVRVRWADNPEALAVIEKRIRCAGEVIGFIENAIGRNLYDFLRDKDMTEERSEAEKKRRRLILIRHGETRRYREKIFLGQTDVPLSEEGKDQCTHVGLELQHFEPDTLTVYSSDLKRSKESARIIAGILGDDFNVVEEKEFREMNLGCWDGMYISDVKVRYPEAYKKRGCDFINFKIDDESENFIELRDRVMRKLNEIIADTEGDVIIVGHSGVNRVIKCELTGREMSDIKKIKFARGTYEILELPES